MFAPFSRLLALLSCIALTARAANPLVSLHTEILTPEMAVAAQAEAAHAIEAQRLPTLAETAALPGFDPALHPLAVARQDGSLFVLATDPAGAPVLLRQSAPGAWQRRAAPPAAVLGAAQPVGQSHIFFVTPATGGRQQLLAYHVITNTWASFGEWAATGEIEKVTPELNGFLVVRRDASGRPQTQRVELMSAKRGLKVVDYVVIVCYLCAVAGIGLYFYLTSKKDTANFFLAGRKIPWWAAGISLYATGTSAISFIAVPAKAYATNWLYLTQNFFGVLGTIYVAFTIVPLVRRLNLMSVYEYLELRFHPVVRMLASLICILQHLAGRMSIVLLLPSLALSAVTGVSVVTSVLIMGIITTIYTVLGGMKAVIWTDVLQVFVMVGGALFAMGWMVHGAGGIGEVMRVAAADHKTHLLEWSFDFTLPNIWISALVIIMGTLAWPQDQVMMQRVLSTKDDRAARGSIFALTAMALPGAIMFFSIGTLLYAFYKVHPSGLNPLLSTDQVFPQFIAAELPAGVTGLIIAGIFAASMATLSSNINSIATLVSVDFYERYFKNATGGNSIRLAEWVTVITGCLGTLIALWLSTLSIASLWDKFYELFSLLGGGFAGIYALGLFTRRANWQGCVIGIVASIVLTLLTKFYTPIHVLMYTVISIGGCTFFGYLGSLFFPPPRQSLRGLTVFDQLKEGLMLDRSKLRSH
jgi:SSS family transporter